MTIWNICYAFICGAMLMMSALGLESAIVVPSLDRWSKRFFTAYFTVLVIGSVTFFLEAIGYLYPVFAALEIAAWHLQSFLYVIPFPMVVVYLLYCCGEDWRKSSLFRAILTLFGVYFILLNVAQFTMPSFYYVSSSNELLMGPLYPLLIAPVLAILLLALVGMIRRRKKLSREYRRAFMICLLPVTIATVIQAFTPVFVLVDVCLTLSAYSMYRIIVSDSIEKDLRHQREIANQRARIAVLQMRPHFIYNTMTSIYYLCDQDPKLAKQVTMDFTTYLRKNFTAIASEDVIPFSEELEHTRAYLAVEQAQFDDGLLVDYDTPHTQFRVPPLTLQPIVENTVKHGMDPDSGPLHIWIRTRETDENIEVIVEDDGAGFGHDGDDGPHIALENIKRRLDMMCGGRLVIAPREAGGTTAKVTIPRKE